MRGLTSSCRTGIVLGLATAVSVTVCAGEEVRFVVTPGDGATLVRFDSKAPLESFGGTTRQAGGEIVLDPAALGDSVTVYLEVDLASLKTGIELRDRHMRDNHLATKRFPQAVFRGARIVGAHPLSLPPNEGVTLEIEGSLALHGVERTLRAPVSVIREVLPGNERLGIECRFTIKLSDFDIPRPQFLALKVADEQQITFRALAARAP